MLDQIIGNMEAAVVNIGRIVRIVDVSESGYRFYFFRESIISSGKISLFLPQ